MIKLLKKKIKETILNLVGTNKVLDQQNQIKILLGRILSNQIHKNISDSEFKVFSQFGEDGIIDFILKNIEIKSHKFIEIGIENYEEANTRFLLENKNWSGIVIECNTDFVNYIKKQKYYWQRDLKVINQFVTKENINSLLNNINNDEISLLSIDIDGNDYWIWKEIKIKPDIVIVEFNADFGAEASVTIPYDKDFSRDLIGINKIYYGASLLAFTKLAREKGYSLVHINKESNNAFFVQKKHINEKLREKSISECFKKNKFSEIIENGCIKKISHEEKKIFLFSKPLQTV